MIKSVYELIILLLKDKRDYYFNLIFSKNNISLIFHSLNLNYIISLKSKYSIGKNFHNLENIFLLKVFISIIDLYYLLIIYVFDL
jgi:hypothetical protein